MGYSRKDEIAKVRKERREAKASKKRKENVREKLVRFLLTSSLRTPKIFVKEFSYFLMPCHQHGLGVNLLVQR